MSTDNLLHFFGGGLIAIACLYIPHPALAVVMPLFVGWVRESEQARSKRRAYEAMTGQTFHPSDVRHWSGHKWAEWLAWVAGALLVLGVYALAR